MNVDVDRNGKGEQDVDYLTRWAKGPANFDHMDLDIHDADHVDIEITDSDVANYVYVVDDLGHICRERSTTGIDRAQIAS